MKKEIIGILLILISFTLSGQIKHERDTRSMDMLLLKEQTDSPTVSESGFLRNVNGTLRYFNGTSWADAGSGGGVSGDTVSISSIAHMLVDSLIYVFGMGMNNTNDTAGCQAGAILGMYPNQQDSLYARMVDDAKAIGSSPNVNVRVGYSTTPYGTMTVIWSGTLTSVNNNSTTFTNRVVPPGTHIWGEINGTPSAKARFLYLPILFSKIRQ